MAQRTYAPQLVRNLKKMGVYIIKHKPKIVAALSPSEAAALDTLVTVIAAFASENVNEAP